MNWSIDLLFSTLNILNILKIRQSPATGSDQVSTLFVKLLPDGATKTRDERDWSKVQLIYAQKSMREDMSVSDSFFSFPPPWVLVTLFFLCLLFQMLQHAKRSTQFESDQANAASNACHWTAEDAENSHIHTLHNPF